MSLTTLFQCLLTTSWWNAINRRLNPADIRSICLLILGIDALIFALAFATQVNGQTVFGPPIGADFGAYYIAGKIYNTVAPDQIYSRQQQWQLYQELFPTAPKNEELPYLNAPFFILPFLFLARLNYSWAFFIWVVFSVGIFVAGFRLLYQSCVSLPSDIYKVSLLMALSFGPFLIECLAGGQTSAVGFFCLAVALSSEMKGRHLLSGLALSLCLYKPTLLILMISMLILTKRYKTFIGFTAGNISLCFVSWLLVGTQGCLSYLKMLLVFADASASSQTTVLKLWKYVDLNSFFRLLLEDFFYLRWAVSGLVFLVVLFWLIKIWWSARSKGQNQQHLVWAITLTWTLTLNVYLGIYDATLVVLSVLLTTQVIYQRSNTPITEFSPAYKLLLLLLYLTPWVTQPIARLIGIQLFTIALVLWGVYQVHQFQQEKLHDDCRPKRYLTANTNPVGSEDRSC